MGWPFELDICFLLISQYVFCQCFYRLVDLALCLILRVCGYDNLSPAPLRCFSGSLELTGTAEIDIILSWFFDPGEIEIKQGISQGRQSHRFRPVGLHPGGRMLILSQVQTQGYFIDRHLCDARPSQPRQCAYHPGWNTQYDTVLAAVDIFLVRSIFHRL